MGGCQSRPQTQETDLDMINYQEELRYFYVICVMFNPARSRSSIKLYLNFKRQMERFGVKLITIECAYEDAPFTLTRQNYEPHNIQVSTQSAFFQKERLINLALNKLPNDAKYVVWCDCDVEFLNPLWVSDTIKALHVFKTVQVFDDVVSLGHNGEEIKKERGFAAQLYEKPDMDKNAFESSTITCGYAWGFRMEALKEIGGLLDFSPLGNCEKIMAYCLAKRMDDYVPSNLHANFKELVKAWQKKTSVTFSAGIGFIPGTIRVSRSFGRKDRKSFDKLEILQGNNFDPKNDLFKDDNELYYLDFQKVKLKNDLKNHFIFLGGEMVE